MELKTEKASGKIGRDSPSRLPVFERGAEYGFNQYAEAPSHEGDADWRQS